MVGDLGLDFSIFKLPPWWVGLIFPSQKENKVWGSNEPEFPQLVNGRHHSNPECLRMSSYLNSYTTLLYTVVFLTKS